LKGEIRENGRKLEKGNVQGHREREREREEDRQNVKTQRSWKRKGFKLMGERQTERKRVREGKERKKREKVRKREERMNSEKERGGECEKGRRENEE